MQQKDYAVLLDDAKDKAYKTLIIVEASVRKLTPYESNKAYSPDELEPYDALSDRFIRCVEMFIKFFKTYDIYQSVTKSDTYRDLLNLMENLGYMDRLGRGLPMVYQEAKRLGEELKFEDSGEVFRVTLGCRSRN